MVVEFFKKKNAKNLLVLLIKLRRLRKICFVVRDYKPEIFFVMNLIVKILVQESPVSMQSHFFLIFYQAALVRGAWVRAAQARA